MWKWHYQLYQLQSLSPGCTTHQLCDPGQVTGASLSLFPQLSDRNSDSHMMALGRY